MTKCKALTGSAVKGLRLIWDHNASWREVTGWAPCYLLNTVILIQPPCYTYCNIQIGLKTHQNTILTPKYQKFSSRTHLRGEGTPRPHTLLLVFFVHSTQLLLTTRTLLRIWTAGWY